MSEKPPYRPDRLTFGGPAPHVPKPAPASPDCAVCGGAPESTLHMGIAVNGHRYEPATSAPSERP